MSGLREALEAYLKEGDFLELQQLGASTGERRQPGREALRRLSDRMTKENQLHRRIGAASMILLVSIFLLESGFLVRALQTGNLSIGLAGGAAVVLLLVQRRLRQLGVDRFVVGMVTAAMELPPADRDRFLEVLYWWLVVPDAGTASTKVSLAARRRAGR